YEMIRLAENMSYNICEQCGSTDNVGQTKGWIYTLCGLCASKDEKYKSWESHNKDEMLNFKNDKFKLN
ncbi:MAG: hypothetical protein AABY22_27350, partial [Nanoarchaeota archaeon]